MLQGLWPFDRRTAGAGVFLGRESEREEGKAVRRMLDIETPNSPQRQKTRLHGNGSLNVKRNGAVPFEQEAGPVALAVGHQEPEAEPGLSRTSPMQQRAAAYSKVHRHGSIAVSSPTYVVAVAHGYPAVSGTLQGSSPAPLSPGTLPSPGHAPMQPPPSASTSPPLHGSLFTSLATPQIVCHNPSPSASPSASTPASPAAAASPGSPPISPPSSLRHCPHSGLKTESFTSGTTGKLLRPGVGIGAGTMREARYEDLRMIQQIGEGGFGKVYYGHWLGSPVAIKVATPHADHPDKQLQEFQREVTNMSTIPPHANVLKLLAACFDPQHLSLITEFCSRGSLYNMLHAPGAMPLAPHQRLAMWLGIAQGMQHLHACRVLHRDLKSANLLLDDVGVVKIGDLGLSRVCSGQAAQQTMTGGLGTFQWMAPEVLTSQNYSEKADVYSFGMVMWESCTCKLPYEGMTAMQAGLRVATQGVRPEIPSTVDAEQAQLIRDCWAAVPDQRPSFPQVVHRLELMLTALQRPSGQLPLPVAAHAASARVSTAANGNGTGNLADSRTLQEETRPAARPLAFANILPQQHQQQQQGSLPQYPWQRQQPSVSPPRQGPSSGRLAAQRQQPHSPQQPLPPACAQSPPLAQRLQQHSSPHAHRQRAQTLVSSPQQQQQRQRLQQPQLVETLPGTVGHDSLQEQLQQEQRQWQQEQAGGQQGEHVLIMVGPPPARSRYSPAA